MSILFGTYNRIEFLKLAVASVRKNVGQLSYEMVIVDGGSTDGTLEWLKEQPDVVLVQQGELLGYVRAFNEGFSHCRGDSVCLFNDDAELISTVEDCFVLEAAQRLLFSAPEIGSVALRHPQRAKKGIRLDVQAVLGKAYVNFGPTKMNICKMISAICGGGIFHPCYRTYASDCEMSCWVWKLGYTVVGLLDPRFHVWHHELKDALRESNRECGPLDSALFYRRWHQGMLEPGAVPNVDAETLARFNEVVAGSAPQPPGGR